MRAEARRHGTRHVGLQEQQEGSRSFWKPPAPEPAGICTLSQLLSCAIQAQGLDLAWGSVLWEKNKRSGKRPPRGCIRRNRSASIPRALTASRGERRALSHLPTALPHRKSRCPAPRQPLQVRAVKAHEARVWPRLRPQLGCAAALSEPQARTSIQAGSTVSLSRPRL